jgi:hypothetical protein
LYSFLSGCGSDTSETTNNTQSSSQSTEQGLVQLVVTDAVEDFVTYQVEIESVTLVKRGGTEVSVLSTASAINFVEYQGLSGLFARQSIPAGQYESAIVTLDYQNAEISVWDPANPGTILPVQAMDTLGEPVGVIDLSLQLNGTDTLFVSPTTISTLTLDLDLAASNEISFETATVQVEPVLVARGEIDQNRQHRTRGLLSSVNTDNNEITIDVLPMRFRDGDFGQFTFLVNSETTYEINTLTFDATSGLTELANLPQDTPIVTLATYDTQQNAFITSSVLAGSSVAWSGADILKGVIKARTGDTLTIGGAILEPENGATTFAREITLMVGPNTTVTYDNTVTGGGNDAITSDQLSVGQRVVVIGSQGLNSFDANEGHVQMEMNRISGQIVSLDPLTLNLSSINKRPVDAFDFSGTGTNSTFDSNPDNYEINVSRLDTSQLEINEWVQLRA